MGLKIKNDNKSNSMDGSANATNTNAISFRPSHNQTQNFGLPISNQRNHVYYQFFSTQSPSPTPGAHHPPFNAAIDHGNSFQHSTLPCFIDPGVNNGNFDFPNQQLENNLPEIKEDDLQAILDSPTLTFEQETLLRGPFEFSQNIPKLSQNIPNGVNRRFGSNHPIIKQAHNGVAFQEPGGGYQNVAFMNGGLAPIISSNLVTQFPQKQRIEGNDFKVSFPSDSSKLVLSGEGDYKRIHTMINTSVTIFFNYKMEERSRIRLLVVYTNEGESATAVHPCRNHQDQQHPEHILLVSGVKDEVWDRNPHPSILITPSVTNVAVNMTSVEPFSYCANLLFLCRNSCLTRKSFTLICQLEHDGQVLARECFLLKVSACPRRDAKAKKRSFSFPLGSCKRKLPWTGTQEGSKKKIFFKQEGSHDEGGENEEVDLEIDDSIMIITRKTAVLELICLRFQTLYPEAYNREAGKIERSYQKYLKRMSYCL